MGALAKKVGADVVGNLCAGSPDEGFDVAQDDISYAPCVEQDPYQYHGSSEARIRINEEDWYRGKENASHDSH